MAYTLLILALSSFRSRWLFPISMLSFSPNCWSRSCASQDLVAPCTPRLLMNAPNASCMTCAMHVMWFHKAGHWIAEASRADCSSSVIEYFEEESLVSIPSTRLSASSKRSSTPFKCKASLAPVCWHLTYHPELAFEMGKGLGINVIEHELNFTQCPISILVVTKDKR